ncbi:Fc.00g012290.m01.CDS01 [Cosmosporella sp. VM-42]
MAHEHYIADIDIRNLLVKERFYRDSYQWKKLRDCYHPDASQTNIKITWFNGNVDGFVSGSESMAAKGAKGKHSVSPLEIHKCGNKAVSDSSGVISARFEHEGTEFDLISYGRFVSRLQRIDGGEWKMLTLEVIYEKDAIHPVVPDTSNATFGIGDGRASYKCLAWVLGQKGFKIDQDLPGADVPGSAEKLMEGHLNWLNEEN